MTKGIQSMLWNWLENIKFVWIGLLLPFFSIAQETVLLGSLPLSNLDLKASKHYFISDVIDARKKRGKALGSVITKTKSSPLELSKNLENVAFDYWSQQLLRRGQHSVPLVVKITTLNFSEQRVAPGKIKGESAIALDFSWYRDGELIHLTSYKSKSEYTRPESKTVHDDFFSKMMGNAIVFFDKWMVANNGKNPALVRGVRLVVEYEDLPDKSDTVFYNAARPLIYADFKAAPKQGRYAAMVFTSISYEGSSKVKDNYLEVLVRLKIYLVKSMSWMLPASRNPGVLKHEQTHFDIAKISADRFIEKVNQLPLTIEDHDSQIQYQFLESYREMHSLQESYDKETRHGLNKEAQYRWEEMVRNELEGKNRIKIQ